MSNFNPAINETIDHTGKGYGIPFCNVPQRRADYEINKGMEQYQFSSMKQERSLDPRPAIRDKGVLNSYRDKSRQEPNSDFTTPYPNEIDVQDRGVPLNRDLVGKRLAMAPSKKKAKSLDSHLDSRWGPRMTMPNPRIPTYNHIVPYQYVEQLGQCPCTPHRFQTVEHVWANGTRVKGYDPRLGQSNPRSYESAIKKSRPFQKTHNVRRCKIHS